MDYGWGSPVFDQDASCAFTVELNFSSHGRRVPLIREVIASC